MIAQMLALVQTGKPTPVAPATPAAPVPAGNTTLPAPTTVGTGTAAAPLPAAAAPLPAGVAPEAGAPIAADPATLSGPIEKALYTAPGTCPHGIITDVRPCITQL